MEHDKFPVIDDEWFRNFEVIVTGIDWRAELAKKTLKHYPEALYRNGLAEEDED